MAQTPSPDMALPGPFRGCDDSRGGGCGHRHEILFCGWVPRTAPLRYIFRLEGATTLHLASISPITLQGSLTASNLIILFIYLEDLGRDHRERHI